MLTAVPGAAVAAGTTYYVGANSCSDTNTGTSSAAPMCSIGAAAKKVVAGDTVQVAAGTYREQVTVSAGVTFRGTSNSIVLGSDNLPASAWTATTGGAWAATPGWAAAPSQVYVGDVLLSKAPDAAGTSATNTWFWDTSTTPATLLVNTGGANPAQGHSVEVTVRAYGFLVRAASGATIDGFTLQRQGIAGVSLDQATTSTTVKNVTVSQSAAYGISDSGGQGDTITNVHTTGNSSIGIRVQNSQGDLVSSSTSDHNKFHGVSIQGGSGNTVRGVTSYANLRPGSRVATGIDVSGSSAGALVEQNTTYGNDDSGIEIYTGSSGAVVRRNLTYDNNDHGIDISKGPSATVTSNTVVGNNSSGINVEGGSTGTVLRDNIAVDNTAIPNRSKGDIRVDAASVPATSIDHDLVFQTTVTSTPIFEWNGVTYTSFAAFRSASGQEKSGLVQAPRFVSLGTRDLRLAGDSPAVDAADSTVPGWSAKDHDATMPVDDPTTPDTGIGSPAYADLGALEFIGAFAKPPVTTVASTDGLTIAVDATNSGTLGEPASRRTIDCGNGQAPVSGSRAQCTYAGSGNYVITVQVTGAVANGTSWTASAHTTAAVQQNLPPTAVLTVSPATVAQGDSVTADGSGSTKGSSPITTYRIDCGNGSAPVSGSSPTTSCIYDSTGQFTVSLTVTDALGHSGSTSQQITVGPATAPQARLVLSRTTLRQGERLTADASGSTGTQASPITGYRFSCGLGSTGAMQARSSTTCTYTHTGTYRVSVVVRNSYGVEARTSATVTVRPGVPPTARLTLSRYRIHRHHAITARAGSSTGTAVSAIAGYLFSCGNGHRTSWHRAAWARCYYPRAGRYWVKVWVRDTLGLVDTATRLVRVRR